MKKLFCVWAVIVFLAGWAAKEAYTREQYEWTVLLTVLTAGAFVCGVFLALVLRWDKRDKATAAVNGSGNSEFKPGNTIVFNGVNPGARDGWEAFVVLVKEGNGGKCVEIIFSRDSYVDVVPTFECDIPGDAEQNRLNANRRAYARGDLK